MPGSILVVCYDTSISRYLVQKAGASQLVDGAVTSGILASGIVGAVHIADGAIASAEIGANVIATPHMANQGILSASIGANILATPHVANQGILSASIGANILATPHVANQGILSASFGAGEVGHEHVIDWGIISGKLASGVVTDNILASGVSIDIAEISQEPSYRAQGPISGFYGVRFSASGYFNYAQAAAVATLPAVGIATADILSGQVGTFQYRGRMTNPAWDFSGQFGALVFVGTSSEVTLMVSGLMVSGRCQQRFGTVVEEDTVFVSPDITFVQIAD